MKRRIDIKVYPATQRVTAVNYYTATSTVNRALRYWCDKPPPHVRRMAARLLPGGTHFHLSDRSLSVRSDALAAESQSPGLGSGAAQRCQRPRVTVPALLLDGAMRC